MKNLGILKVTDQHNLQCVGLMYNMIKGFCPDIFGFRSLINEATVDYNLRSVVTQPENIRTVTSINRSFTTVATAYWNELPPDIKKSSTTKEFKSRVRRNIIQDYLHVCECSNPLCVDRQYHSDFTTSMTQ